MEIRESREGDVLVLAPDGSLAETEETSALEAKLASALKGGTRLLVMDCSGVGLMASTAIRSLLQASRKIGRSQGRLVLCGMNAKVGKAFSISGFDKDFTVVATLEEALARVAEPVCKAPSPTPRAPAPKVVAAAEAVAPSSPAAEPPSSLAAEPPPPTGAEAYEALAVALLDVLGVRVLQPAAKLGAVTPKGLDAVADGILAALRGRAS